MNHCVPDFEDEDYALPTSAGLARPKKSALEAEEDIMELLWQNGQVVVQSQNQRSLLKKSHIGEPAVVVQAEQPSGREIRSEDETATNHLFMQEDEMASWLHYPLDDPPFDRDLYTDLLLPSTPVTAAPPSYRTEVRPPPPSSQPAAVAPRPPMPPSRRVEMETPAQRFQNFLHFSRPKGRMESGPSNSTKAVKESTVADSNDTPAVGRESRVSNAAADWPAQVSGRSIGSGAVSGGDGGAAAAVATSSQAREPAVCEVTVTSSSPGGSGASVSASAEPSQKPPPPTMTGDGKRKGREAEDADYHSEREDVEFESADTKKQARGSTSTKRSRAAEVHNLSERRRRDRINEKMKALQELIPRCNKSDKASMLDEAIEYLKSLQMQVQMMSMGCSMVPVMFPGVQQYMPPMGMGIGMGMRMDLGMGMGMNRPMVPFPSVLPGSAMQSQAAAAHLGPRFPMPAFHMPPVPVPDPSRNLAINPSDLMLNSLVSQTSNQPRIPHLADPYQQYLGLHHAQVPLHQNQSVVQPSTNKQSSSREIGNSENQLSG